MVTDIVGPLYGVVGGTTYTNEHCPAVQPSGPKSPLIYRSPSSWSTTPLENCCTVVELGFGKAGQAPFVNSNNTGAGVACGMTIPQDALGAHHDF